MSVRDSKALSQERFGKYSDGYVISQTHARGLELDRLVEIAQPAPDWLVLDVATGGGHTALAFAPHVGHVVATDITPPMLENARAFIASRGVENVSFEPADAEDLPFADKAFDLVTCRIAPHHFPECDRFVQHAARVLKPGGLLLVQDQVVPEDRQAGAFVNEFERLRDPSHNRAYSESEWVRMFERAGLHVEHRELVVKPHDFASWAQRQDCAPDVIQQLVDMVQQAPQNMTAWIEPRNWGSPQASFVNQHIILAGRRDGGAP